MLPTPQNPTVGSQVPFEFQIPGLWQLSVAIGLSEVGSKPKSQIYGNPKSQVYGNPKSQVYGNPKSQVYGNSQLP